MHRAGVDLDFFEGVGFGGELGVVSQTGAAVFVCGKWWKALNLGLERLVGMLEPSEGREPERLVVRGLCPGSRGDRGSKKNEGQSLSRGQHNR
jgi:hypothetical protein